MFQQNPGRVTASCSREAAVLAVALQDRRPVAAAVVVVVVLVVVFRWRIKARPASNPVSGKLLSTEPVSRRPPAHSIMADNRIIKVGRVWPAGGDGETLQTHFSSLFISFTYNQFEKHWGFF